MAHIQNSWDMHFDSLEKLCLAVWFAKSVLLFWALRYERFPANWFWLNRDVRKRSRIFCQDISLGTRLVGLSNTCRCDTSSPDQCEHCFIQINNWLFLCFNFPSDRRHESTELFRRIGLVRQIESFERVVTRWKSCFLSHRIRLRERRVS